MVSWQSSFTADLPVLASSEQNGSFKTSQFANVVTVSVFVTPRIWTRANDDEIVLRETGRDVLGLPVGACNRERRRRPALGRVGRGARADRQLRAVVETACGVDSVGDSRDRSKQWPACDPLGDLVRLHRVGGEYQMFHALGPCNEHRAIRTGCHRSRQRARSPEACSRSSFPWRRPESSHSTPKRVRWDPTTKRMKPGRASRPDGGHS